MQKSYQTNFVTGESPLTNEEVIKASIPQLIQHPSIAPNILDSDLDTVKSSLNQIISNAQITRHRGLYIDLDVSLKSGEKLKFPRATNLLTLCLNEDYGKLLALCGINIPKPSTEKKQGASLTIKAGSSPLFSFQQGDTLGTNSLYPHLTGHWEDDYKSVSHYYTSILAALNGLFSELETHTERLFSEIPSPYFRKAWDNKQAIRKLAAELVADTQKRPSFF